MSIQLQKAIETYVNSANAGDAEAGSSCFTEKATVVDEGETLVGREKIREWINKTRKKYNHKTKPLTFKETDGHAIMTAEVTGTFPGSPITLTYSFKIENGLIADLRVV